ncbi:hypothetical protein G9P44_002562 [Scheffersomyces stipitis]|nr:hypothetical protein G9P44_002562 [Scheffersomyces stipitis]
MLGDSVLSHRRSMSESGRPIPAANILRTHDSNDMPAFQFGDENLDRLVNYNDSYDTFEYRNPHHKSFWRRVLRAILCKG